MTVIVELEYEKSYRVFTKGATELLVNDCESMDNKEGETIQLDLQKKEQIK